MKPLFLFFVILFTTLISTPLTGAFSGDVDVVTKSEKVETIQQLRENITELEQERNKLKEEWQLFLTENGAIQDLLKEDITEEDEIRLREIISLYNVYKTRVLSQLESTTDEEKKQALKKEELNLKQDLYKKLVYFIKIDRLEDFLSYVKLDLEVNEKRKDVAEEIDEDKKKLESKVNTIREKIEENKKTLDKKIRTVIEEKLDEKISKILNDERFSKLKTEEKIQLFMITLDKLSTRRGDLEAIDQKTSLVNKQIETFNIIEEKLKEVIEGFESEEETQE